MKSHGFASLASRVDLRQDQNRLVEIEALRQHEEQRRQVRLAQLQAQQEERRLQLDAVLRGAVADDAMAAQNTGKTPRWAQGLSGTRREAIGAAIRDARQQQGLLQCELVAELGMVRCSIQNIERGRLPRDRRVIERVLQRLGLERAMLGDAVAAYAEHGAQP